MLNKFLYILILVGPEEECRERERERTSECCNECQLLYVSPRRSDIVRRQIGLLSFFVEEQDFQKDPPLRYERPRVVEWQLMRAVKSRRAVVRAAKPAEQLT